MGRSFSQRVLAGVCGGIAETLRVNAWFIRFVVVGLSLLSGGFGIVVYLVLWWVMPQKSALMRHRLNILTVGFVLLVIVSMSALWWGRDAVWLQAPNGQPLFIPLILLYLGVAFLLRQVRA